MCGWWFGGLIVISVCVVMVNSKVDLDSPLKLAHCRATCLLKINMTNLNNKICESSKECIQCWETCQVVQRPENRLIFCHQSGCGLGCQEACRFSQNVVALPPVLVTHHSSVLVLHPSSVSWPPPRHLSPPTVYLVTGRQAQLGQTLDLSAPLPLDMDPQSVRVLVVDWRGLTEVLGPPELSPVEQTRAVVRSLGLDESQLTNQRLLHKNSTYLPLKISAVKPWRLKEVSMIQQSALVLTQVSWEPQQPSQLMYLVTWEVDGGVLRGNLLTNSTSVTLSLWPDTVYRIQVSLFTESDSGAQSEPLVLDTHHVHQADTPVHLSPPPTTPANHSQDPQLMAAVAVAVTMFLLVTLTLTWKWHHRLSLPHSKLLDEESVVPRLYRVFPPIVSLSTDTFYSRDAFLSTENLLQH